MSKQKVGPKCIAHQLERTVQSTRVNDPNEILRFDDSAVAFSTGVLTYLVNEIFGAAVNEIDAQSPRITPKHLRLAIKKDEELDKLIKDIIFGAGSILDDHNVNTESCKTCEQKLPV